jgi:hypothetical protein
MLSSNWTGLRTLAGEELARHLSMLPVVVDEVVIRAASVWTMEMIRSEPQRRDMENGSARPGQSIAYTLRYGTTGWDIYIPRNE